jgi:hypothetical protein
VLIWDIGLPTEAFVEVAGIAIALENPPKNVRNAMPSRLDEHTHRHTRPVRIQIGILSMSIPIKHFPFSPFSDLK